MAYRTKTYIAADCEHQWGQTYTFDKMWIIDRVANLGKMIER